MANKGKNFDVISYIAFIALVGILAWFTRNMKFIPVKENEILGKQSGLLTVSTVFSGFSFTTLGMLLGMNSQELVKKIKNTSIVLKIAKSIIKNIIFFLIAASVSLVFISNLFLYLSKEWIRVLYLIGLYSAIVGFIFFLISVYRIGILVINVYKFDFYRNKGKIDKIKSQFSENSEDIK